MTLKRFNQYTGVSILASCNKPVPYYYEHCSPYKDLICQVICRQIME
ncbi:hypothetical protein PV797_07350 [Clostridiaceae bacterium M8S5]|nr:hypothetical protein PV797_07350 [Clostridiaceae bacterium M8S5]